MLLWKYERLIFFPLFLLILMLHQFQYYSGKNKCLYICLIHPDGCLWHAYTSSIKIDHVQGKTATPILPWALSWCRPYYCLFPSGNYQFDKLTIKLAHQKWPGITERQRMNYVWNRIQVSTVEFSNATWKSYLDIYRRWNNTTQRIFHWVKKSLALFFLSCVLPAIPFLFFKGDI